MRICRGLVGAFFLGITIIVFNALQMLTLILRPFSQKAFRRLNCWMAGTWWGLCVTFSESLNGTKLILTGDDVPSHENALIVLNHQSMTDIPVVLAFARRKERLGDLKWFVKDIAKYVPGIGWGMLFLDCLFIKRNWTDDRHYILKVFERILKYSIPIWLISFVEGTRLTPAKLARSRRYAEEKGIVPLQHVLMPRTKGFTASVRALEGHLNAVYDLTIGYVEGVPTLWQWIRGDVREVHVHVRHYPVNQLSRDDESLSRWLLQIFREKDDLLDGYYQSGKFSG